MNLVPNTDEFSLVYQAWDNTPWQDTSGLELLIRPFPTDLLNGVDDTDVSSGDCGGSLTLRVGPQSQGTYGNGFIAITWTVTAP